MCDAERKPRVRDVCTVSSESIEAQVFCKECTQSLCLQCNKIHSMLAASKFHNDMELQERCSDESLLKTDVIHAYCSVHPKREIEIYCCDCRVLICYVCHFESHGKHNCQLLHDAVAQKKEEFGKDEGRVRNSFNEGCDQLKNRKQKQEKTLVEVTKAAQSIEEAFDSFIRQILGHKAQLLKSLEAIKEGTLKEIDNQEDQLFDAELESFLSQGRMLMERGTDCEVIRFADELHKRAEELIKSQDERNKQQLPECCIKFIPSPPLTLEQVERLVGKIINTGEYDLPANEPLPAEYLPVVPTSVLGPSTLGGDFKLVEALSTITADNAQSDSSNVNLPTRISYIKLSGTIRGVTVLDDQIFYVTDAQMQIFVYNWITCISKLYTNVLDLKYPRDLTSCSHNKALYISDLYLNRIHRVNLTDNSAINWWLRDNYEQCGLSVTSEHNLLVTVDLEGSNKVNRVVEYTSKGELIRDIELDRSIKEAWQTVKLSSDLFIICYGGSYSTLHRLCVINSEGEIIKSYGRERGQGEGQLNEPVSLSLDSSRGHVFVADRGNKKVLMFNKELDQLAEIQTSSDASRLVSVFYSSSSDRLYIVEFRSGRF